MALPLPRVVSDVGAGGPLTTSLSGINALAKENLQTRFLPLQTAIKAQNALSYSNRMGNAGLFLRSIAQMPAAERQAYLANPTNRANYNAMLETFRTGMTNPQASGNVLSPEYASSVLGTDGGGQGGGGGNPLTSTPSREPSNPLAQDNGNPNPSPMDYGARNKATPEEVTDISNNGNGAYQNQPGQKVEGTPVPETGTGYTPENAAVDKKIEDSVDKHYHSLTQNERDTLSSQLLSNNQSVGTTMKNRADSAMAFDKFLMLHRNEISKVFSDAAKYNQIYGRSKKWLEMFRKDQPEEYANYINAKNALGRLMANGIRFMEGMGISHEAQTDAMNQVTTAIDRLDVSPETAIKVMNSHIGALQDVSEGILSTAEPRFPGVRKKLAGIEDFPKDFIQMPSKSKSEAKGGRMRVISKDGHYGTIPASQWKEAEKKGYRKA
jgi:hypothetical protein